MAILGFIAGLLVLGWLSFGLIAIPYISKLSGGMGRDGAVLWFVAAVVLIALWLLLFAHAPFTITAGG